MLGPAELHVYHDIVPRSAAMNMALDEALLAATATPALRFYRWRGPSLSFGYFGRFADLPNEEWSREIVRRWTGGGIVLHGRDLTYSMILPRTEMANGQGSRAIYAHIHDAIRRALSGYASPTLAAQDAPKISEACFANAVTADVLIDGRKIAGAAQRRTRNGLLHQGSIQYPALPNDFAHVFAATLCPNFSERQFAPALLAQAERIAAEKYATAAWLHRC